jgi:hypothetical protein
MKWIPLYPSPEKKRKPRLHDLPPLPPEERPKEMRWRIDPQSQAADALRTLKKNLIREDK